MNQNDQIHRASIEIVRGLAAGLEVRFGRRLGVMLFVLEFARAGEVGSLSYAGNMDREDAITAVISWLDGQDAEMLGQAIERWRAMQTLGPGAEQLQ